MGIRIELPKPVWEQVLNLADREYRTPKQQAEYLILRALGVELPFGDDSAENEQPNENSPKPQVAEKTS